MDHPTSISSVNDMTDTFLEEIMSPHQLFVTDSKMPEAGFRLFAHEEIPAGIGVFRATPIVSVV